MFRSSSLSCVRVLEKIKCCNINSRELLMLTELSNVPFTNGNSKGFRTGFIAELADLSEKGTMNYIQLEMYNVIIPPERT